MEEEEAAADVEEDLTGTTIGEDQIEIDLKVPHLVVVQEVTVEVLLQEEQEMKIEEVIEAVIVNVAIEVVIVEEIVVTVIAAALLVDAMTGTDC